MAPPPFLRHALGRLPGLRGVRDYIRHLEAENARLTGAVEEARRATWVPPGHYASPIPDPRDLEARAGKLFGPPPRTLPGIDLNEPGQLAVLEEIAAFYPELPFPETATPPLRYFYDNIMFGHADVICLYGMLRRLRPRRVVEVGSGFSSAAMLDVDDLFLGGRTAFTFVEPEPERLLSLLRPADHDRVTILREAVQDVDPGPFLALGDRDVLFVDSSHVVKTGSDVNHIVFEILPRLAPGVVVHFHDVFYPFEYPKAWALEGRAWNEDHLLRALLQDSAAWEIVLFKSFLEEFHGDLLRERMPLSMRNRGGSLWIRRR